MLTTPPAPSSAAGSAPPGLAARADCVPGDPSHTSATGYYCEFSRQPLTAEEVTALELPAWPEADFGWLQSEYIDVNVITAAVDVDDVARLAELLAQGGLDANTTYNHGELRDVCLF